MDLLATSNGSALKRAGIDGTAPLVRRVAAVAIAIGLTPSPVAAQLDLLPNERAFAFSARGLSDRMVEARFVIADGYYLYRDRLKFTVEPGGFGSASLPRGKIKEDPFFGKVDTYRTQLAIRLPLTAPLPGRSVTVNAESQGCADAGVCYPPQLQKVTIVLPIAGARPGALVEAAPHKKFWFN